eukprot:1581620-Rhodomonas_salina.1
MVLPGATGGVGGHPNANVALFLFFGDTTTLHPRPLVLPPAVTSPTVLRRPYSLSGTDVGHSPTVLH